METKFKCSECHKVFEAKGKKAEWEDPIYGPCFKYIANCPSCKSEAKEYQAPKNTSSTPESHNSGCGCCSKAGHCDMAYK